MNKILWIVVMIVISNVCLGQNIRFKRMVDDGVFAHSSITAIEEDQLGRMWFGTREGLFMYDGYKLKSFHREVDDSLSITSSWIQCLKSVGTDLWVGTDNGMNRIDLNDFSIHRYYLGDLVDNSVRSFLGDEEQGVWIWTTNGMFRFSSEKQEFVRIKLQEEVFGVTATCYYKNQSGEFIVATDRHGLFYFYPKTGTVKRVPNDQLKDYRISDVKQDINGRYYLATRYNGVIILDGELEISSLNVNGGPSKVFSLEFDDNGILYVATDGEGVFVVNSMMGTVEQYVSGDNNGLESDVAYRVFRDKTGMLWVGMINGGVCFMDRYSSVFKHLLKFAPYKNSKLDKLSILDIVHLEGYNALVATDGEGLFKVNVKTEKVEQVNTGDVRIIKTLYRDSKGHIWGGAYHNGLIHLDEQLRFIKHFKEIRNPSGSYHDDSVWAIEEDADGRLWLGTLNGGLFWFDQKRNLFLSCAEDLNDFELRETAITTLKREIDGTFWVGTKSGAYRYDQRQRRFISFPDNSTFALSNQVIRQVLKDGQSGVWIGTENGLNHFDNGEQNVYTRLNGLSGNRIQSLLRDMAGRIWVATSYGLNLIEDNEVVRIFLKEDGLSDNIFNSNGGIIFPDGSIALNTIQGLTYFNPGQIQRNIREPEIIFTSLWINGSLISAKQSNIKEHISVLKELELDYSQRSFSLEYAALNFYLPQKNQYMYKLEGFDEDWIVGGNERKATYTNLEPGEYVFKVKASNNDGVWNEDGISLPVVVMPPWWDTWWANLIYLALLIGVILVFREYTVKGERLKNAIRNKELEAERKEEIERIKAQFFTNISHDLRTPLSLIVAPVSSLIKKDEQLKKEERLAIYETIKNNCDRLLTLVNQLLDYRKLESGKLKLRISEIAIDKLIYKVVTRFKNQEETKKTKFSFEFPGDEVMVWADRRMMENIFSNLISNAIKYGDKKETRIEVGCKQLDDGIKCWVKDNGVGIAQEEQSKIFDRFYQSVNHGVGSGIGLAFVKELVNLHHGEISVVSELNEGATFEVVLKLGADHFTEDLLIKEDERVEEEKNIDTQMDHESDVKDKLKQTKLLIVEDSLELSNYLKNEFADTFKVKTAVNGKEGLKLVETFYPDIIISDVMMPEMDGNELCKKVKTKLTTSHIPIILLTAKGADEHQMEGFESGADAYITKPFNIDVVRVRVDNLLQSRAMLRKRFSEAKRVDPEKITVSESDKKLLQKLNKHIETNIRNSELSIEGIAEEVGISRGYFHKKMKALTGASPSEYIRNYRLKKAAELLAEKKYSIEEISFEVGFSSPSYFSRSFTKFYGVAPKKYVG
ncbi:hybrid sensor histidine kinase/response regulator [Puteibacter caeruleilacunae]|nr:hybrid sensor histidine kinase/response regulator [Puteibacter caeruleilacunae]